MTTDIGPKSVLLLDDNQENLALLGTLFDELGAVEVSYCKTGVSALTIAKRVQFALAVIDINLPDMDGIEVANRLCALHPDCALIFCSAHSERQFRDKAFGMGAMDFIEKPFDLSEARHRIALQLERLDLKQNLADGKQQLETMISSFSDAVVSVDATNTIVMWNPAAERVFGIPAKDVIGTKFERFVPPEMREAHREGLKRFHAGNGSGMVGGAVPVSLDALKADGTRIKVELLLSSWTMHDQIFVTASIKDITESDQLKALLRTDDLTGCFTRRALTEDAQKQNRDSDLLLCLVDIDHFKSVNDVYGHKAGDHYLISISEHLRKTLPEKSRLYRLGGEEFVITAPGLCSQEELRLFAQTVHHLANEVRIEVSGRIVRRTVSVGATALVRAAELSEALTVADIALDAVKANGRNNYQISDGELSLAIVKKLARPNREEILDSLDFGGLQYFVQPVIDVRDQKIHGLEALIRWRRGDQLLTPDLFLEEFYDATTLHDSGKSRFNLARKMLQTVETQDLAWISLNVRADDLIDNSHRLMIDTLSGLNRTHQLAVEISESAFGSRIDETKIISALDSLRSAGFLIALDDFGRDNSNFNRLLDWPIDILKMDKLFVNRIQDDKRSRSIVELLVSMADRLQMQIVAEGIENEFQADTLKALGVYLQQGYFFAKPLPIASIN